MRQSVCGVVAALCSMAVTGSAGGQQAVLVGHWPLNESAGTLAADVSGNALNGTLIGPVTWTAGQFGSGLLFDPLVFARGVEPPTEYVQVAHNPSLNFAQNFSLSFWVKAPFSQQGVGGDGIAALIDKSHGSGGANGWVVQGRASGGGAITFALGNGSSFPEPAIPGVLDDTWHHVAIVVEFVPGLNIRGYVDGALQTNFFDGATTAMAHNVNPLLFGAWYAGGAILRPFRGRLDDIRLYSGVLSLCEIAALAAPGGFTDCDTNGLADGCGADCNSNGVADACDIDPGDPDGNMSTSGDCNSNGVPDECDTAALAEIAQQAYVKASNTEFSDEFAYSVAISGNTMVVGAYTEDCDSTGVNGNQNNNSAQSAGAAYIFVRSGGAWTQQAYLKASNTNLDDRFGFSVAISGDTVVVGAPFEDSAATGINGNQSSNSAGESGAAYVFARTGGVWSQQAYLKASNTGTFDQFGFSVAISETTVIVGAPGEASTAIGVNGNQTSNSASNAGAAYVFTRTGSTWTQQAYLKASNTGSSDNFGESVAISGDTAVVSAPREASAATGVNGNQADNSAFFAGAAYVFNRNGVVWTQQAYLKASNTGSQDEFGRSLAISGSTVVVGTPAEDSAATGINGNQADNSATFAGAAYVFARSGAVWTQQAYLKASNTNSEDLFGYSVAISGETVVVGARGEDSNAIGVNGIQTNNMASFAGAAYAFSRSGGTWSQQVYLKASNTDPADAFGSSVAISGGTVVVGATGEGSAATGVNGNQFDNNAAVSGAAYVILVSANSNDCNTNSTPDECESAGSDCNSNGIDDICEQLSSDCNTNATPDLCEPLPAGVIAVRFDAPAGGDGLSWATAHRTLQGALSAAAGSGGSISQVWVVAGTYRPDQTEASPTGTGSRSATFQLLNGVAIYGGFVCGDSQLADRDPVANETILSGDIAGNDGPNFANRGENCYHVVTGTGTNATAVLDGFTICGGYANGGGGGTPADRGGGMVNEPGSPTARLCTFTDHFSLSGGAAMSNSDGANPTVTQCEFFANRSNDDGAAILNRSCTATVTDCDFQSNVGNIGDLNGGGGAISNNSSSAMISGCTFTGNSTGNGTRGGAIVDEGAGSTITDCAFEFNAANGPGGAIHLGGGGSPVIDRCRFFGNSCGNNGGAIEVTGGTTSMIRNSAFSGNVAQNHGGAIQISNISSGSPVTVLSCSFSNNVATTVVGGAVHVGHGVFICHNSIMWANQPQQMFVSAGSPPTSAEVAYCDLQGGQAAVQVNPPSTLNFGLGNIAVDPRFVDADGADNVMGTLDDDLHLMYSSPCIDRGVPGYVLAPGETDIDGQMRVRGCRVDIGADEVPTGAANTGDVNGDGAVNALDVPAFAAALLGGGNLCSADMNFDGLADGEDVAVFVDAIVP